MKRGARIRRNSTLSFVAAAVRMGTNMLLFVGIARFYGAEAFGQFATAHVYLTLFLYLADFGLDLLLATEIAQDNGRAKALIEGYLPLKLAVGIIATVAMWGAAFSFGSSLTTMTVMVILSLGLLATTLSTFYFAIGRGFEQLHHEALVVSGQQGVLLVALLALGVAGISLEWIAVAFVASRILGLMLIQRRISRRLSLHIGTVTFRNWRRTFAQGLPWGGNLVFGALYFQLDTLLISGWLGDQSAGIYQSAMKLVVVVLAIPDVMVSALLPVFARLYAESRERWEELGRIASKTMMYLALPFGLAFMIYPEEILALAYGAGGFIEAAPVLRVLGAVLIVRFSVELFALALTTTQNQMIRMRIVAGATLLNLTLNVFAIPLFGILGAAYVSLICNIAVGVGYIWTARRVGFQVGFLVGVRSLAVLALSVTVGLVLAQKLDKLTLAGISALFVGCPILSYTIGYTKQERQTVFALPTRLPTNHGA